MKQTLRKQYFEMVELVKEVLAVHEKLSSDLQHLHKKQGAATHPCNATSIEVETKSSPGMVDYLA